MSEWWTYHPEDFLLFSERVYWRLFELHNAALWPAQIAAFLLGALILVLVCRPQPWAGRVIAFILSAAWLLVAWAFFWNSYASINWASRYVVPFFVFEGLLIAWAGSFRGGLRFFKLGSLRGIIGIVLFAYSLAVHPLVPAIAGRPLAGGEVFGLTPDPTAIGTLGLISMMATGRVRWLLLIVPLGWCTVSWATLQTMGAVEAWIPLVAIIVLLLSLFWDCKHHRKPRKIRGGCLRGE